jgi:hypothetical protein
LAARTIPVMRAALVEAQQPLDESTPEIRGTFTESPTVQASPTGFTPVPTTIVLGKKVALP